MKYVPLKAVLNYISTAIQEEEKSETQLLSWAMQALRSVEFPQKYERKICFLEVKDNKATLPQGWREINLVTYMVSNPTETDVASLAYCIQDNFESNCSSETEYLCKIPINFGLFVASTYYNNNFRPLRAVQKYKGIGTKCCTFDDCSGFSIKGDCIYVDYPEGILCIDYDVEYNIDGNYLIPDDADLMRGLAEYIKYMHWEGRGDRHEERALSISEMHLIRAERLLQKAKGKFFLRAVDEDVLKGIMFGQAKIFYVPSAYANRGNGY